MSVAVLFILSDDGQVSVGEVDPAIAPADGLQPVESMEEGVHLVEQLLVGESPVNAEEAAFNSTVQG